MATMNALKGNSRFSGFKLQGSASHIHQRGFAVCFVSCFVPGVLTTNNQQNRNEQVLVLYVLCV